MTEKIKVGVLGATGTVGQRFVSLLNEHPWFTLTTVYASERSAGKTYGEACHWILRDPMPAAVRDLIVQPTQPDGDCTIVFSSLPTEQARTVERAFAQAGFGVYSNASAHRYTADVPLLIPEVNPDHLGLIPVQQAQRGWSGYIVTNANCTTTHLVSALHPLHVRFGLKRLFVCTMQAVSGAGYPGVSSMDILDNIIPYIGGEEEKVERKEPQKLLGHFDGTEVIPASFRISAHCNRVATRNGHLEAVSVELEHTPTREEVLDAWKSYYPLPQQLQLPSAPDPTLIYMEAADRPQPRLDRLAGSVPGMATLIGRLRPDPLFDFKFLILGHNTIRGAAGGSLLNAELIHVQSQNHGLTSSTPAAVMAL